MPTRVNSSSAGAARMRLLRQRRREGAICITVEVFECELELMVRQGLLEQRQVRDREAVADVVGKLVETWFYQSRGRLVPA
jgi:hypothetical protein